MKSVGDSVAEATATAVGSVTISPSARSKSRVKVSPGCSWEVPVGFWFVMLTSVSVI
jgi:hypothetical protein